MAAPQEPRRGAAPEAPAIRRAVAAPGIPLDPGAAFGPVPDAPAGTGGGPAAVEQQDAAPPAALPDPPVGGGSDIPGEPGAPEGAAAGPGPARQRRVALGAAAVVATGAVAALVAVPALTRGHDRTAAVSATLAPQAAPPSIGTPPASPSASPSASASPSPSPSASPSASRSAKPAAPAATRRPAPPVAAGPLPIARWWLNSATRAYDTAGGHQGTATGVQFSATDGAAFNGSGSSVTASGPVVDTGAGAGFTVAASVYLTKEGAFATAVSQDGNVNSGFYLQYSEADHRWAFARVTGDAANAPGIRALSLGAPALQRWTRLVGVYDGRTGMMALYVDGRLQGTAQDTTPFAATGDFVIGRGRFDSKPADWFPGRIRDVRVYDRALTAAQIAAL